MKYYLIVGEASGDLHASHLMQSLCRYDADAQFRFFGGDLMTAVGGTRVRHYRELAYMGFVPVLLHLPTIFRNMAMCKRDIVEWQPDVVILVDYPGFNLNIAQYLHSHTRIPVFYYISPKIWAWKEWRIRNIKRDVSELFSILPFEVPFFEERHHYPIHYVGNPTADEVRNFRASYTESRQDFGIRHQLDDRPIIALLAGSRRQEIKDNLPMMIAATERLLERRGLTRQYQMVLAGAPSIDDAYYAPFLEGHDVAMVRNEPYPLLSHAVSALVTSGTATLETALFGVPQVVCYHVAAGPFVSLLRKWLLHVPFVSLVNLICGREAVRELVAGDMTPKTLRDGLAEILPGGHKREAVLAGYAELETKIGQPGAPDRCAEDIINKLNARSTTKD